MPWYWYALLLLVVAIAVLFAREWLTDAARKDRERAELREARREAWLLRRRLRRKMK